MNENNYMGYDEACLYLGMPRKYLENYTKVGEELNTVRLGRRKVFKKTELDRWKQLYDYGHILLDRDDYIRCLKFALTSYYNYRSASDFGTATQRDAGKFISNFVSGKLGEIAVQKFLKFRYGIDIRLDFDIRDAVIGQDIAEIALPRRGPRVFNPPRVRISIKTTKMKNVWLVVPANELDDPFRSSDFYILARVDLFLNHFVRFFKSHDDLADLNNIIPDFEPIPAQVCGFAQKDVLMSSLPVTQLPAPIQEIQPSYIMRTGDLQMTQDEWGEFIEIL